MKRYAIIAVIGYCTAIFSGGAFPDKHHTTCEFIAHLMSAQRQQHHHTHPLSSITGYAHHNHIQAQKCISPEVATRIARDFGFSSLCQSYSAYSCNGIHGLTAAFYSIVHNRTSHHSTSTHIKHFLLGKQHIYDQCMYKHAQQYHSYGNAQEACLDHMSRTYRGMTVYTAIQKERKHHADNVS